MRLSHFLGVFSIAISMSVAQGQEKAGTTLLKALGSLVKSNKEECEELKQPVALPQNSLTSPSNGITPTGNRLQPFGQPEYWGRGNSAVTPSQEEDELAMLPPLPDLRTPDQITKAERKRNLRNAKFAARHEANVAAEEAKRAAMMAQVQTAPVDPSTALIQVESKRDGAQDYGRRERPTTVNGGNLKPFNSGSAYVEGSELKYQWSDHQFVESQPDEVEDELGMLPPLPDLRTPDQVTKREKVRNLRNLKFRARQAREDAVRRAIEEGRNPTFEGF